MTKENKIEKNYLKVKNSLRKLSKDFDKLKKGWDKVISLLTEIEDENT